MIRVPYFFWPCIMSCHCLFRHLQCKYFMKEPSGQSCASESQRSHYETVVVGVLESGHVWLLQSSPMAELLLLVHNQMPQTSSSCCCSVWRETVIPNIKPWKLKRKTGMEPDEYFGMSYNLFNHATCFQFNPSISIVHTDYDTSERSRPF